MPGYENVSAYLSWDEHGNSIEFTASYKQSSKYVLNKRRTSITVMHCRNSLFLLQIIMMLLFGSQSFSRPLLTHFWGRRTTWQMGCLLCSYPPLWLQRPIHSAQGAICAALLQGRGTETRQHPWHYFQYNVRNVIHTGFFTIQVSSVGRRRAVATKSRWGRLGQQSSLLG